MLTPECLHAYSPQRACVWGFFPLRWGWHASQLVHTLACISACAHLGMPSPGSHQRHQSAPQRLCTRTHAQTHRSTRARTHRSKGASTSTAIPTFTHAHNKPFLDHRHSCTRMLIPKEARPHLGPHMHLALGHRRIGLRAPLHQRGPLSQLRRAHVPRCGTARALAGQHC